MEKYQCRKCRWEGKSSEAGELSGTPAVIYYCPKCYTEVKQDYEFFTIQCPQCNNQWSLRTEDLNIRSCEGGGIYNCQIECSKCKFTQDLLD